MCWNRSPDGPLEIQSKHPLTLFSGIWGGFLLYWIKSYLVINLFPHLRWTSLLCDKAHFWACDWIYERAHSFPQNPKNARRLVHPQGPQPTLDIWNLLEAMLTHQSDLTFLFVNKSHRTQYLLNPMFSWHCRTRWCTVCMSFCPLDANLPSWCKLSWFVMSRSIVHGKYAESIKCFANCCFTIDAERSEPMELC